MDLLGKSPSTLGQFCQEDDLRLHRFMKTTIIQCPMNCEDSELALCRVVATVVDAAYVVKTTQFDFFT